MSDQDEDQAAGLGADELGELGADELRARLRAWQRVAAALEHLANLPLPNRTEWSGYHVDARLRLARVHGVAAVLSFPQSVAAMDATTDLIERWASQVLSYAPDPAALPKKLEPIEGMDVVVEGGSAQ